LERNLKKKGTLHSIQRKLEDIFRNNKLDISLNMNFASISMNMMNVILRFLSMNMIFPYRYFVFYITVKKKKVIMVSWLWGVIKSNIDLIIGYVHWAADTAIAFIELVLNFMEPDGKNIEDVF
jgi:hypothetical protein